MVQYPHPSPLSWMLFLCTWKLECDMWEQLCLTNKVMHGWSILQPSRLNQNIAVRSRWWSWKVGQIVVVHVTNNIHCNKETSIVHGCALHWCRDSLNSCASCGTKKPSVKGKNPSHNLRPNLHKLSILGEEILFGTQCRFWRTHISDSTGLSSIKNPTFLSPKSRLRIILWMIKDSRLLK